MAEYYVLDEKNRKHFKKLMSEYCWNLLLVRKDIFAMGAVCDNNACGYMIVERNEEGYIIQDIFVHPDFRRKGIATGFIHALVKIAEIYVEDIDIHFIQGEDDGFKKFLDSTNLFEYDDGNETKVYRGDISLLYENEQIMPFCGKESQNGSFRDFYEDCPMSVRKKFISDCMENEWLPVFFISAVKEPETKYCYVMVSNDGEEVLSYIKINAADDTLYLESLWCKRGYIKDLMILLATIVEKIKEEGTYKYFETCTASEETDALVRHIVPKLKEVSKGMSAYWNYESVK